MNHDKRFISFVLIIGVLLISGLFFLNQLSSLPQPLVPPLTELATPAVFTPDSFFDDYTSLSNVDQPTMNNVVWDGVSKISPVFNQGIQETQADASTLMLFHLNENVQGTGQVLTDSSGLGNNGTTGGDMDCTALGRFNTACNFDGVDDAVSLGPVNIAERLRAVTVSAWVKSSATINGRRRIVNQPNIISLYENQGKFQFWLSTSAGSNKVASIDSVQPNRWYHLVGTYDGTALSIYLDGQLKTTTAHSGLSSANTSPVVIGAWDQTGFQGFQGVIDEAVMWNRALSANEIQNLFAQGAGGPQTASFLSLPINMGGGFNAVTPSWVETTPVSSSFELSFDGGISWCASTNGLQTGPAGCNALQSPASSLIYKTTFSGNTALDSVQFDWANVSVPVCGDGVIEGGEVCESTDLNNQTCITQGFTSGTLACNATCTGFDTSQCVATSGGVKTLYVDNDLGDGLQAGCSDTFTRDTNTLTQPFCTIQHAADVVNPGDTVEVRGGTYLQNAWILRSGTSAQRITFKNHGTEKPIFDEENIRGHCIAIGNSSGGGDYVTIEGFTCKNVGVTGSVTAIAVYGTESTIIRNNRVFRDDFPGALQGAQIPVSLGVPGIVVSGPATNTWIEYNTVFNVPYGIRAILASGWGAPSNPIIRWNHIHHTNMLTDEGGAQNNSQGIAISNSTVNALVEHNVVHHVDDNSLAVDRTAGHILRYNILYLAGNYPTSVGSGSAFRDRPAGFVAATPDVVAYNIGFLNRSGFKTSIDQSNDQASIQFFNNISYKSREKGMSIAQGPNPPAPSMAKGNIVFGNDTSGVGYLDLEIADSVPNADQSDYNFIGDRAIHPTYYLRTDQHSLSGIDPKLANLSLLDVDTNGDGTPDVLDPLNDPNAFPTTEAAILYAKQQMAEIFGLQPSSPLIDKSIDFGLGIPDFNGNSVIDGNGDGLATPDIGPFEYNPAAASCNNNGIKEAAEQCDGSDFGTMTGADAGIGMCAVHNPQFNSGSLTCSASCTIDVSACKVYEGFGAATKGGAGGAVYHVTSLANTGAGTLRDAVSLSNRYVVFDIAGDIVINGLLSIAGTNITVDGSSAPAPGITIKKTGINDATQVRGADIILNNLRFVGLNGVGEDNLALYGVTRAVIDHVSSSLADDGALDITWNGNHDITVSWSFFHDTDKATIISYGPNSHISLHHNVWGKNTERNPQLRYENNVIDYRNNIIYHWAPASWGYGLRIRVNEPLAGYGNGITNLNIINNAFIAGANYPGQAIIYGANAGPADDGGPGDPSYCNDPTRPVSTASLGQIYAAGNLLPPGNVDCYSTVSAPLVVPLVTTHAASELCTAVVPNVGTSFKSQTELSLLSEIQQAAGCAGTGNQSPIVSTITHDAVDREPATRGLQVYAGDTITFTGAANDPDNDPLTWQWLYTINNGAEIGFTRNAAFPPTPVQAASYTYPAASANQTYNWILRASDGQATSQSNLMLTFISRPATVNQKPIVSAGSDQLIAWPINIVTLNGKVEDDGLPKQPGVTTGNWTKISGGAVAFANAAAPITTATFSTTGLYLLRLTASDSLLTDFDEVSVLISPQTPTANYTLTTQASHGRIDRSLDLAAYPADTTITLTAVPDAGWYFDHWSDALTGSQNPATITLTANQTVTANFNQIVVIDSGSGGNGGGGGGGRQSPAAITTPLLPLVSNLSLTFTCPSLTGPFAIGMRQQQVTNLQQLLAQYLKVNNLPPALIVTGLYDPATIIAVQTFQRRENLLTGGTPQTTGFGLAGSLTRQKLNTWCQQTFPVTGSTSARQTLLIQLLQRLLMLLKQLLVLVGTGSGGR